MLRQYVCTRKLIHFDSKPDYTIIILKLTYLMVNYILLLRCIYRSPNSNADNDAKLNELLYKADIFPADYKCIVGDFNFPSIDWKTG